MESLDCPKIKKIVETYLFLVIFSFCPYLSPRPQLQLFSSSSSSTLFFLILYVEHSFYFCVGGKLEQDLMMMMHRSIKNIGLSSVLLLSSSQKQQQASKLPLLAVESSRLLLLSDHVGGGVCSPASSAAAMGSRRFFHATGVVGGGEASLVKREPTKTNECQIISSFSLQRETDDDISNSTKVSLNQFPGIMAPHSPQSGLTPSEIMRRSKTRRLLRLNPSTGYFEEQQDVAAADNHHSHDHELQVPYGHVCRGSAYGWLFLTDDNLDMKLLNPFSGEEIQLPPVKTLPPSTSDEDDRWPLSKWFVRKAVFSANPSIEPRPIVLVTYGGQHIPRLAFCKPGDEEWTPLEFPEGNSHQDAIYHKGQFYVLSYPGYVAAYDIGRRIDDDDHSVKISLLATPPKRGWKWSYVSYLVVVYGELVRIELRQGCFCDYCKEGTLKAIEKERKRNGDTTDEDTDEVSEDEEDYTDEVLPCIAQRICDSTYGIKLRRLDVSEKQWVKMESLGDKAVFVGYNTSFALTASDYPAGVCIPDSIYFTHGEGGNERTEMVCYDSGIFNVKDKSVKPLYPSLPIDGVVRPPPIWIVN